MAHRALDMQNHVRAGPFDSLSWIRHVVIVSRHRVIDPGPQEPPRIGAHLHVASPQVALRFSSKVYTILCISGPSAIPLLAVVGSSCFVSPRCLFWLLTAGETGLA